MSKPRQYGVQYRRPRRRNITLGVDAQLWPARFASITIKSPLGWLVLGYFGLGITDRDIDDACAWAERFMAVVHRPQVILVGERGREVAYFPPGTEVVPHGNV